jgi:T-complex protein 1 subunit theta
LAENAGRDPVQTVANLRARHAQNLQEQNATVCDAGVDIDLGWQNRNPAVAASSASASALSSTLGITSMKEKGVVDLVSTKMSALRLAVDAVITILKIDQIIMSKPAGAGQ